MEPFRLLACLMLMFTESFCNTVPNTDTDNLIVRTGTGPVQGVIEKGFSGKELLAFYGIPYAEPPVGELRFKSPVPVKPWTEVLDATHKPVPCYQFYTEEALDNARKEHSRIPRPWSEDCLTLNVFVPQPVPDDVPVLVFIHGGGFTTGSSVFYRLEGSPTFTSEAKIIIVTMNYRLGAFGFLNLDNPDAPGNAGLLDQQLALKWVNDNIQNFGTKSGVVVLGGIGAGGASVGYHVISEGSAGLFKTGSIRSGSPTCSWAYQSKEDSLKKGKSFVETVGCKHDDEEEVIKCLRNTHAEDIVDAEHVDFDYNLNRFRPTVDGNFMKESPLEALKAGRVNKVKSLIVVTTANEGSTYLARWNSDVMKGPQAGMDREGFRVAIRRVSPNLGESGLSAAEETYLDTCREDKAEAYRDAAMRAYSDKFVDCCVNEFIDHAATAGLTGFRYVYIQPDIRRPSWMGSIHGVDFEFIFGFPTQGKEKGYTEAELSSTIFVMDWIGSYARKTVEELTVTGKYPIYNLTERPYTFWTDKQNVGHHYRVKQCVLWDEIVPALEKSRLTCEAH